VEIGAVDGISVASECDLHMIGLKWCESMLRLRATARRGPVACDSGYSGHLY
jgi:hypothetical protein